MARIDFEEEEKRRARAVEEARREPPGGPGDGATPEERLIREDERRTHGIAIHAVIYTLVLAVIALRAPPSAVLTVALAWGIGIASHYLGWAAWRRRNQARLGQARQVLQIGAPSSPAALGAPPTRAADLSGVAGDLLRQCEGEALEVARLLASAPGDAARAAEVEATVRGGLDRVRDLLRYREAMDRVLGVRDEAAQAREREELLARIAATEDAATQDLYRQSLQHLESHSEGVKDLRAIAARIEAQARAFADALKVMQVDLLRLQAASGLDDPTALLVGVADRARRLTGEVQSLREVQDEVARAQGRRGTVGA